VSSAVPFPQEAIRILQSDEEDLRALLPDASSRDFTRPEISGGDWSVKDLLGHITFWYENALDSLAQWRAGEPYELAARLESKGVDGVNAASVLEKGALPAGEIELGHARASAEMLRALESIGNAEWETPLGEDTRGSELGSILGGPDGPFRHIAAHLDDLRASVDSP